MKHPRQPPFAGARHHIAPSIRIWPAGGRPQVRAIRRNSVGLPQPEGPNDETTKEPSAISRLACLMMDGPERLADSLERYWAPGLSPLVVT